jgi:hypothetical protein
MMKFAISLKLKIRVRGKCLHHPRYNPNHGEAAIVGGCKQCLALFAVSRAADRVHEAVAELEELAKPYQLVRSVNPLPTTQEK